MPSSRSCRSRVLYRESFDCRSSRRPGITHFVFLSAVISTFISQLFSGMTVEGAWQFRVTRNSDLFVDDEEVDNLLRAIEGELAQRRYGAAVRLETSLDCPEDITNFLLASFRADARRSLSGQWTGQSESTDGDLRLGRSPRSQISRRSRRAFRKRLAAKEDIFAVMRERRSAAASPVRIVRAGHRFLAAGRQRIPMCLRSSRRSIEPARNRRSSMRSCDAARAGKEVTVIIELMARFDEAANIQLATRLQEAGAHVMYGVVGYKTHAKLIMVVRRERGKLRRYCHFGTGNYHPNTARVYTDYGLFTCDRGDGRGSARAVPAAHEPDARRDDAEDPAVAVHAARVAAGEDASRDGVRAPGQAGSHHCEDERADRAADHSDAVSRLHGRREDRSDRARHLRVAPRRAAAFPRTSRVRSIIGRFLEHSRVFYFHNDGDPEIYCASADWMERNFFRRIEVAFPIERKQHRDRIVEDLETYLADNTQAWMLGSRRQLTSVNRRARRRS